MAMNLEERGDWTPLIMGIAVAMLTSVSFTTMMYWQSGMWDGGSDTGRVGVMIAMLAMVALLLSVIFLVCGQMNTARPLFVIGILLLIVDVAMRAITAIT